MRVHLKGIYVHFLSKFPGLSVLGYYLVLSFRKDCTYDLKRKHVIAISTVFSIILLGASVWSTQKTVKRTAKSAIVYDQLIDVPSVVDFKGKALEIFEEEIKMNYLSRDSVDVNTLRLGPKQSVLAVFRVHSGVFDNQSWLITGEEFSESWHVMDQIRGLVHIARCSSTSELVFAIGPEFIREYWRNLDGCVILLMGCETMDDTWLADEMVDRGASAVVGWKGPVSIDESDEAALMLLEALLSGSSIGEAVEQVEGELRLEGRLVFHPAEAYGFRLPT